MNRIRISLITISILLSINVYCQSDFQNLTTELLEEYKSSGLTGFAVSIVNADTVLYKKAFGYENIKTNSEFSLDRRFSIASISKTFIGISLMKLVEAGELQLSTPINSILPFQVVNPYHENTDITIEHLARHTSSILWGPLEDKGTYVGDANVPAKEDVGKNIYGLFKEWSKNSKVEFGNLLEECLSPEGELYSKKYFSKEKPGSTFEYSNTGAALAAYIIELKTGVKYSEYVENLVSKELNFKPGIWRHILTNELPTSYFETKVETPAYRPILYPTGGMLLSCNELTQYLKEMIRGYEGNSKILSPESFKIMMSNSKNGKGGIFWELEGDRIGHNGGNYGTICLIHFDRNTGVGKVFMTNISSYINNDLLAEVVTIVKKLIEYENKL